MTGTKNHEVVAALTRLLADSYVLALKTQNYHWNVKGENFSSLHALFEAQYGDLIVAIDDVAERIRALGEDAPGSFTAFSKAAVVKEDIHAPADKQMLKNLAQDHETLAQAAEGVIKAAQEIGDEGTADLAIARLRVHQKAQWMLKAHLS